MKEKEIEWFENNWNRGKSGRKAQSHGRVWKLTDDIWNEHWEGGKNEYYYNDARCWKSIRKNQYHIKKVLPKKNRKLKEREHWRFKQSCHSWHYRNYHQNKSVKLRNEKKLVWDYNSLGVMESIKIGDVIKIKSLKCYWSTAVCKVSAYGYDDWGKRETLYLVLKKISTGYSPFMEFFSKIIRIDEFHKSFIKKIYK